jgi:hypothetical protein
MNYNVSTNLYEAIIPAQPDGTLMKYKIVAYDNVENMAVKDDSGKYYTYQIRAIYKLTITASVGGTVFPAPGTYFHLSGDMVAVSAMPNSSYIFHHWELDGVNVGSEILYGVRINDNHTLRAVFSLILPLSATISPLSESINVGNSLTFTALVTGGVPPYGYQWYLNGDPVQDAKSNSWILAPASSGIYYAYFKITDNLGNTTQSETACITVAAVPVGGYSFSIEFYNANSSLVAYLAVTLIFSASFVMIRRKATRKTK